MAKNQEEKELILGAHYQWLHSAITRPRREMEETHGPRDYLRLYLRLNKCKPTEWNTFLGSRTTVNESK